MNAPKHDLDEFEQALSQLPLREPSPMLDHRIGAALKQAANHPDHAPPTRRWWVGPLAIAAMVALITAIGLPVYLSNTPATSSPRTVQTTPAPPLENPKTDSGGTGYHFEPQPVNLRWSRDIEMGTMKTASGQPVKTIRRQSVDQEVWVDPERGTTMQTTRPSEKLYVVSQSVF